MRETPNSVRPSRLQFYAPGLLDTLVETQTRLRVDYRHMPEAPEAQAREFMRSFTAYLEFLYFSAIAIEVAVRHGAKNERDVFQDREQIFREIAAFTKLIPQQVLQENAPVLAAMEQMHRSGESKRGEDFPELEKVVSAVNSILQACPVGELVAFGNRLAMTEHASRCQGAYEGLQHFARRNDAWMHQRLKVLGVKYTLGEATIEEIAAVLELPIADTVALLEDHGYSRPLAQVALTERTRVDLYARLREYRRTRSGKPSADPNRVTRTVVASQRIEGIDARPWVPSLVK